MRMSLSAFAGMIAVGICCSASAARLAPILKNTIVHSGNGNGMKLVVGNNTLDSAAIHCEDKFGNGCVISVNTAPDILIRSKKSAEYVSSGPGSPLPP